MRQLIRRRGLRASSHFFWSFLPAVHKHAPRRRGISPDASAVHSTTIDLSYIEITVEPARETDSNRRPFRQLRPAVTVTRSNATQVDYIIHSYSQYKMIAGERSLAQEWRTPQVVFAVGQVARSGEDVLGKVLGTTTNHIVNFFHLFNL